MDEHDFRNKCDAALETLRRRLLELGDEHGFEVEGEGGKLEVLFEEPEEAKFVISPNAPARQIWISALATSFKLGWSDKDSAFVLDKTGETLPQVMGRILIGFAALSRRIGPGPEFRPGTCAAPSELRGRAAGSYLARPRAARPLI